MSTLLPCLLWIIYSSFSFHIHVMIYFILIHLLTLVFLSHLEMCIFIVSSPVWRLNFCNPFFRTWFVFWFPNLFLSYLHPMVQIWHIVWFESPVHLINSIPRNKSTWSQTFPSIYFQNMSSNLGWTNEIKYYLNFTILRLRKLQLLQHLQQLQFFT